MKVGNHQSCISWADEYRCTACNIAASREELESISCTANSHTDPFRKRGFSPTPTQQLDRMVLNASTHRKVGK